MFLEHFRLREQPFGVTPDPRYLFPSPGHREALASLIYGIESNLGFSALIAEPGMGKTTLLFHILEQYRQSARTAFIFNTQCNSYDLMRSLLNELDDNPVPRENFQLHERLKQILAGEAQARRRVVFVIDEAQNLGDLVMETVRLLSNFESANVKLLHIILAGQPELAAKLTRHEQSQLQQRIPILASLECLSREEIDSYIDHRLRVAGYQGRSLFTPEARGQIARLSRGVPREINRLCFNCLSLACASAKPVVDLPVIEEVAADLDLNPRLPRREQPVRQYQPTAGPALGLRPFRPGEFAGQADLRARNLSRTATIPAANNAVARSAPSPRTAKAASRRDSLIARQPRVVSPAPGSLSYGRRAWGRPVGFALFYLALLAAGWAAINRWGFPSSLAAGTTSPTNTGSDSVSATQPSDKSHAPVHPLNRNTIPTAKKTSRKTVTSGREGQPISTARRLPPPRLERSNPPTPTASQSRIDSSGSAPWASTGPPPELVKYVRPQYPEIARDRHIEGTVVLSASVARDGTVKGVKPVSGDPALLKAAETAVRGWVYRPYQINGKAVDVDTEIIIRFSLSKERP